VPKEVEMLLDDQDSREVEELSHGDVDEFLETLAERLQPEPAVQPRTARFPFIPPPWNEASRDPVTLR
jgi:hypothetical protein